MSAELIEQLRSGICQKHWQDDTRCGMIDAPATNDLMARAAVEIERLNAEVAECRHHAECYWYADDPGEWARDHCVECRTLWEAVEATRKTANQREGRKP